MSQPNGIAFFRGFVSSLKLIKLTSRQAARAAGAFLRGDRALASRHTKSLLNIVHDDLLSVLVTVQKRFGFWQVTSPDIDRILIIKLDRIGDMVNATPVFDALHRLFPKARLDLVGHPGSLCLVDGDNRIAKQYAYRSCLYHSLPLRLPDSRSCALILALLRRRYPLVVYLRGSFPFLLFALTSRLAATKFVFGEPVIERNLKPLEQLFGPIARTRTRLRVQPEAAGFVKGSIFSAHLGPRVAIQPTANATTREWPKERFAILADALRESFGADVHFFASRQEQHKLEAIAALARHRHSFHSCLTLAQTTAAIAACNLLIGNESGLVHIATAVGTPCIVVWGSSNLNMCRADGPPEGCTILYHELSCRATCPESYCVNPLHLDCLKRIQVVDVLEAARSRLEQSGFTGKPVNGSLTNRTRVPSSSAYEPHVEFKATRETSHATG